MTRLNGIQWSHVSRNSSLTSGYVSPQSSHQSDAEIVSSIAASAKPAGRGSNKKFVGAKSGVSSAKSALGLRLENSEEDAISRSNSNSLELTSQIDPTGMSSTSAASRQLLLDVVEAKPSSEMTSKGNGNATNQQDAPMTFSANATMNNISQLLSKLSTLEAKEGINEQSVRAVMSDEEIKKLHRLFKAIFENPRTQDDDNMIK